VISSSTAENVLPFRIFSGHSARSHLTRTRGF
jgi:hypothetical protein